MKPQKVSKSISRKQARKIPDAGTPAYQKWKKSIAAGRARAQMRRREAGLLTLAECAERYGVPVTFIRRLADRRELAVIDAGARRYVRQTEAVRIFGEPLQGGAA